jgi:hypothetical protein
LQAVSPATVPLYRWPAAAAAARAGGAAAAVGVELAAAAVELAAAAAFGGGRGKVGCDGSCGGGDIVDGFLVGRVDVVELEPTAAVALRMHKVENFIRDRGNNLVWPLGGTCISH